MNTPTLVLFAIAALVGLIFLPSRLGGGRAGSPTAQRAFKRDNAPEVQRLLGPDGAAMVAVRRSPWMDVLVGGRHVRMVAARLEDGRLQAGVELLGWEFGALQIWHTTGARDELDVPAEIDAAAVAELVRELYALDVDSLAAPAVQRAHILRVRFDAVLDLASRLQRVAPVLERLEALVMSGRDDL